MEKKVSLDSRAQQRLRWIEHYEKVSKKVLRTARYFGISRGTFYLWYHRYMRFGLEGLKNKSSRPHKIHRWIPKDVIARILILRQQRHYGPLRMSLYVKEKYNWFVSKKTVYKIYQEYGMNRLRYKKRWQRYPQRYAKDLPGDRVQMDTKFLDKAAFAGKQYYQFTAIDDCTRYRVLRIYDHNTAESAIRFVEEVRKALPFAMKQIQTGASSASRSPGTSTTSASRIAKRKSALPRRTARWSGHIVPTRRSSTGTAASYPSTTA